MKRWYGWYLSDAVSLMHAYIWCYQVPVHTTSKTVDPYANFLWLKSVRDRLSISRDWHADFERTIKQAVERAYVDFNHPLVMPPKFYTLSDEILSDISGFFAQEAA